MISKVSEPKMHLTRWVLAVGWLVLVCSSFYDPISFWLTDPNNLASPIHVKTNACVLVQGQCLPQVSYVLGPRIFWGAIVPIGIIILLVGGHEFWRRICPLSFISQIPRRLGIQRKQTKVNPDTGAKKQELVGVKANSWLGENFLYLQLGLFFVGLNIRLLVANGDGVGFAIFMLGTFAAALVVGYLYKGKSWCQYFCPMAPVQTFYNGTRGLLGSDAHLSPPGTVTQSMCRAVDAKGQEKSGCVSCQSPCIDIDVERLYWKSLNQPDRQLLFYGYFGLMFGFFGYFYLYAGNWDYYYSGVWAHDVHQLSSLFGPGFYLADRAIPIPKIVAVPLTLSLATVLSYYIGKFSERLYQGFSRWRQHELTKEQIRHNCYTMWVYLSYNVFFIFAGRPNLQLLPSWVELIFNAFSAIVSTLWLQRTWHRSQARYQKENLTGSLRRQLQKLEVNWQRFLEGRDLKDLATDEVYVLAKVLPGFNQESRMQVYQGVLQEALAAGKAQSADSLELLQDIRAELKVSEEDHYQILAELGIEDPQLLDPNIQRTQEDKLRVDGYRQRLEQLLMEAISSNVPVEKAISAKLPQIDSLRQEYGISNEEHEQVLVEMFQPDSLLLNTSASLLARLKTLSMRHQALTNLPHNPQATIYQLLRGTIAERQESIVSQLLKMIELFDDISVASDIAWTTGSVARSVVKKILNPAKSNLAPDIIELLLDDNAIAPSNHSKFKVENSKFGEDDSKFSEFFTHTTSYRALSRIHELTVLQLAPVSLIDVLEQLMSEVDPLVKAASLHALEKLNKDAAKQQAQQIENCRDSLLQEIIDRVLVAQTPPPTSIIPLLTIETKSGRQQQQQIYQQQIVRVGRADDNDVTILDSRISRYHARLIVDYRGVQIDELDSANGLRIGKELFHQQSRQLKTGDTVYFGPNDDPSLTVNWSIPVKIPDPAKQLGTMDKLLRLHASPLFKEIPPQRLVELARRSELRLYQAGEIICAADTPSDRLWLLISGSAQVGKSTLVPGRSIGEMAVLTNSNYPDTAIATGPKNLTLAIAAASFNELIANDSLVARTLLALVSRRWRPKTSTSVPAYLP
jgi:hypothetical protein